MTSMPSRPWYVSDRACEEYREIARSDREGGDLRMIKSLKLLRSIIVNIGIIILGYFSIINGGAPTAIGFVSLAILGGYNGLEFSDYLALVRAYHEVQDGDGQSEDSDARE